jgi:hypothetical protein
MPPRRGLVFQRKRWFYNDVAPTALGCAPSQKAGQTHLNCHNHFQINIRFDLNRRQQVTEIPFFFLCSLGFPPVQNSGFFDLLLLRVPCADTVFP